MNNLKQQEKLFDEKFKHSQFVNHSQIKQFWSDYVKEILDELLLDRRVLPYPEQGILGVGGNKKEFYGAIGYNLAIDELQDKINQLLK